MIHIKHLVLAAALFFVVAAAGFFLSFYVLEFVVDTMQDFRVEWLPTFLYDIYMAVMVVALLGVVIWYLLTVPSGGRLRWKLYYAKRPVWFLVLLLCLLFAVIYGWLLVPPSGAFGKVAVMFWLALWSYLAYHIASFAGTSAGFKYTPPLSRRIRPLLDKAF